MIVKPSDRNMEIIDGAELLKEIRESFDFHGIPFLMTGPVNKITKEDLSLLAEYDIDGYLTKPFTPKTLIEKITQCVEHYKNPNNFEYIISQAKELLKNNKNNAALTTFMKLLEISPNSARIRVCIARCYRNMNDLKNAIHFCKEATEKNTMYAQSHDELGKIYLALDKIDEAVACFKNGIAISPKFPPRYEYIIDSLISKGVYKEAQFILETAIENSVKFDDFNLRYGETLFFLNKQEKAIMYFEKALQQDPSNKKLLNLMGICYKELNRGDDALKLYNMALKRYPTDTKILFNKALCLMALDRNDQAKKIFNSILALDPGNEKAITKLSEIK